MTIELRKTGTIEPAAPATVARTERVRQFLVARRMVVVAVGRKHAYTAWQVGKQLPPLAVPFLLWWTPRGAWRLTTRWVRYVRDEESALLRAKHAAEKESGDYTRVSAVRSDNLAARARTSAVLGGLVVALGLAWWAPDVLAWSSALLVFGAALKLLPLRAWHEVLLAAAAGALAYYAIQIGAPLVPRPPAWLLATAALGLVAGLGWAGRPIAKPLIKGLDLGMGGRVPPLTAPMVTEALIALGNSKMKEPSTIKLLSDPHRHGPGVQVDLEIPVPATWVMEHREELATALRRELGTVWPSVGKRHPGHLSLYVADQPMSQAQQAPWPLMRDGQVDLFRPVPVATDQMGRWVHITLAYCSGVIGAVPRMGKTFMLRQLLLIAGLDPRAKVYAFDGKGTGDLAPCQHYAEYVGVGDEPEDIAEQLEVMRGLRAELRRRAKVIRSLPREQCPESKVTSALASRRDLGLEPIVVGVDETQTWFEYGDKGDKAHKAIREEFASICTDLAKRGPALGFICLLATQQVNANTIPTSISNNAVIRFCMKVFGHVANDQILGTGARKTGLDASMFSFDDKGIGYLAADGAEAQIVRTVFGLDAVAAEKVAKRARELRAAAGRLPADDVTDAEVVADIVTDVRSVLDDHGRRAAQHAELVAWLVERWPNQYAGLDVDELSARLRARGVVISQVWANNRNAKGVDLRKQAQGDEA